MPLPSFPFEALRWEGKNGLDFPSKSSLTTLGRRGREASSRAGPFSDATGKKGSQCDEKEDLYVSLNLMFRIVCGTVSRTVLSTRTS